MISGWISFDRSNPAASEIMGVLVTPPGNQNIDGDAGAVEVFGHSR